MERKITIPKQEVIKNEDDNLWYVNEQQPDGTWKPISMGYLQSAGAYACLGRQVDHKVKGETSYRPKHNIRHRSLLSRLLHPDPQEA